MTNKERLIRLFSYGLLAISVIGSAIYLLWLFGSGSQLAQIALDFFYAMGLIMGPLVAPICLVSIALLSLMLLTLLSRSSQVFPPISEFSFPEIQSISDDVIKEDLIRAVRLLNVDSVDVGLFQLGKIFEQQLKAFLIDAQLSHAFSVSNNDLDNLSRMIECLDRNGLISHKRYLTFLREERNERAHGKIPSINERKRLLPQAIFIAGLYIEYIGLFYEKHIELQTKR
jgi:hypothetical protein